uniref:Uncharacterized protein n=1 Tax=Paulinella longichromatophora TaxID=1708747 RepID=A0A2H4ZP86_9EUKA|nr:hypothetical protein PLO_355 [Paulinella longichromatophora]
MLQAGFNRLVYRFGSHLTHTAAKASSLVQETPEKILQQWELFCEEVKLEAQRIEDNKVRNTASDSSDQLHEYSDQKKAIYSLDTAQDQVDRLRVRIVELSLQLRDLS